METGSHWSHQHLNAQNWTSLTLGTWKNKRASCLVPHIHVEVSKVHTGHGGKNAEICDFMWISCAALPTSTIVWACLRCVTQMDWLKWNLEPKGWQISQFLGIETARDSTALLPRYAKYQHLGFNNVCKIILWRTHFSCPFCSPFKTDANLGVSFLYPMVLSDLSGWWQMWNNNSQFL